MLCLILLQGCGCLSTDISSTINDQIESLRLAQSYTNVTGLLDDVVASAETDRGHILGRLHSWQHHNLAHGMSHPVQISAHARAADEAEPAQRQEACSPECMDRFPALLCLQIFPSRRLMTLWGDGMGFPLWRLDQVCF